MIEFSLEKGPKDEKIRQKLMTPFSCIISPGSKTNIPTLSHEINEHPRCQRCGAYFSHFCKKEDAETWTCSICSQPNKNTIPSNLPDSQDFQFVVHESFGEEILVLYLSLDFHENDLKLISSNIITFLTTSLQNKPVIFLIGHEEAHFSILCPHISCYKLDGNNSSIKFSPPEGVDWTQFAQFPAPLMHLTGKIDDISKFIFAPNQVQSIINTVEKIQPVKDRINFQRFVNSFEKLISLIQSNPLHIISIIPKILSDASSKFSNVYKYFCRIDILTPTLNQEAQNVLPVIPGVVHFFNSLTLLKCLLSVTREQTIYQCSILSRISGASPIWKLNPSPYSIDNDGVVFSPVLPSVDQPFILDLRPKGNMNIINIQITSKMTMDVKNDNAHTSVLRVFNRTIELTEDVKEIAGSINPNTLMWLWITRTLDQPTRDVLAALYRATARVAECIGFDDEKSKRLIFSCCSQKFSDLMALENKRRVLSRYSMCLSNPNQFSMTPLYYEEKGFAVFGNVVYSKMNGNKDADEAVAHIFICGNVETPIPEWCKAPDQQTLDFVVSLIP